jgi:hypothetical protein
MPATPLLDLPALQAMLADDGVALGAQLDMRVLAASPAR